MGVIKRQGIKNTITGYLGIAIGFINLVVVQPHFLSQEELGLTRLLYSFSLLLAMFVPMGIGNATIRYFPLFKDTEKRHHGYFGFMNLFPLAGFLFSAIMLWVFRDFIFNQYRKESPLFLEYFDYVFPLIFFNAFIAVMNVYCSANYKSTIPAFLNDVVVRILTISWVSVYFLRWVSLDQFITGFVGIYGLQLVLLLTYIFAFDKPGFRIEWKIFREKKIFELIRYGLLFWLTGLAALGLKYFDSIMIGKFMPLAFVGIYTIAAFIPTVIEAPLNAFERIASAKIAFAWAENDQEQIKSIYRQSSLFLFLLGGFLFLLINMNIHSLLQFLPEGYQQGERVVLIISIGTLFNMATGLNAPILFNSDKYRYGATFLFFLAFLILILQYIFIPLFGIIGAALATAGASFLYNSMLFYSVRKFFKLQPFDHKNIKVLLTVIAIFLLVYWLPRMDNLILDLVFRTVIVSVLYFAAIYRMNIVPEFHRYLPWNKKKST